MRGDPTNPDAPPAAALALSNTQAKAGLRELGTGTFEVERRGEARRGEARREKKRV